ncbi:MAG: hypothetical protein HQM08_23525 [Candidatus Riflebacteria bacterium]|nr:hypothetical protein [Candidatus Riflebacteria bacterium]
MKVKNLLSWFIFFLVNCVALFSSEIPPSSQKPENKALLENSTALFADPLFRRVFKELQNGEKGEFIYVAMDNFASGPLKIYTATDSAVLAAADFSRFPIPQELSALKELIKNRMEISPVFLRMYEKIKESRNIIFNLSESPSKKALLKTKESGNKEFWKFPVIVFAKNPMKSFSALSELVPIGVSILNPVNGKATLRGSSFLAIMDEPLSIDNENLFSVKKSVEDYVFDLVVSFELAQTILIETYGSEYFNLLNSNCFEKALPWEITDRKRAFREGFSIAMQALCGVDRSTWYLIANPGYRIFGHLKNSEDYITRQIYFYTGDLNGKWGKNASQILSTSGIIASILLEIMKSQEIKYPFEKIVKTFLLEKPMDLISFIKGFEKNFPMDRATIYRIFLEGTNCITADSQAYECFNRLLTKKCELFSRKIFFPDYKKTEVEFSRLKEAIYERALKNGRLIENLGPELWFSAYSYTGSYSNGVYFPSFWNFDLNTADYHQFSDWRAMATEEIIQFLEKRKRIGYFEENPILILKKIFGENRFKDIAKKYRIEEGSIKNEIKFFNENYLLKK